MTARFTQEERKEQPGEEPRMIMKLLLAPPVSSWFLLVSLWLLLAPPGFAKPLLALPGSSWRLLAPDHGSSRRLLMGPSRSPGSSWLLMAPPCSSCFLHLEHPRGAKRSHEEPGGARGARRGHEEEPRGARKSQEEPGEARRGQKEPKGAWRSQDVPGEPRMG